MKGDYTRITFRPERHFNAVRLQQGRVQVDADFNEQIDIAKYRDETTTEDVVGDCGAPIHNAGFLVSSGGDGLSIGPGRYYVDGILCENEEDVAFTAQPDFPGASIPSAVGTYLAYLDVWERHISSLEDASLLEVALGGPDTATRTQTVWQVKLEPIDPSDTCNDFGDWRPPNSESTGSLRARATPAPPDVDECVIPPGGGFRRLENHLYRVEIHDPSGPGGPTFKWSRDNGTVAARLDGIENDELTVSNQGRDDVLGFSPGDWVELSDGGRVLRGEPGILVQLGPVRGNVLEVAAWPAAPLTMADFGDLPTVRRWDSEGAPAMSVGAFIELEDGVEVEFSAGHYRSGDYWVIPARTLTGDVEWRRNGAGPMFEPRRGIEHHFCPVAIVELENDGTTWSVASDCRELFPPLTELTSFFYVGGDGQEAMPDPTDASALIELPRPIEAGVANGEWPVEGARVRFEITEGNGNLVGGGTTHDVTTGADGIASAAWEVDSTNQRQKVTAALIDASEAAHHLEIRYSANLSVADQVAYDPVSCAALNGAVTVQSAIDRMSSLARLYHVGGDGQEGLPGAELLPLRALVANGCGPIEGAKVRFEVTIGDGALDGSGTTIEASSGADGIAQCVWQLGAKAHRQQVEASLVDASGHPLGAPAVVQFGANLSVASQVAYDPSKCPNLKSAGTVQQAIDLLCGLGDGAEPGIKVHRITLVGGDTLENDGHVAVQQLAEGIRITCDRDIDQDSVRLKPVVEVVIDLPFPLLKDDIEAWGEAMVGTMPLTLSAENNSDNNDIFWFPAQRTRGWLTDRLPDVIEKLKLRSLLAHLVVKGNYIWAGDDPELFVDAELFGMPGDGNTAVRLPSGDNRRGGSLEMWFRLTAG